MREFVVRTRETVIVEYVIEAENMGDAAEWWKHGITPKKRTELRTVSWEFEKAEPTRDSPIATRT